MLAGNVLITGGAGFLGRAIIGRALAEQWPARFTVLSRDDAKHAALQKRYPHVETVLGDVSTLSRDRLTLLLRGFDLVIHAAASKYVDRSEHSAWDTIQTNVEGSRRVAEAAILARVPRVVGVSTDKAVAPRNNYGATKMLMERLFQEADRLSEDTTFTLCRYGNVVASTGSVLALFQQWVAEGKPILLTDSRMTRFWMSPDEAIDTVLQATRAPGGVVVIPRCRSMDMHDVALTALGYDEHRPLPTVDEGQGRVEIIGLRPGEKLHEALLSSDESIRATRWWDSTAADDPHSWRWIYVSPPDSEPVNESPFEVVSNQPPGGWIGPREMREMMRRSGEV